MQGLADFGLSNGTAGLKGLSFALTNSEPVDALGETGVVLKTGKRKRKQETPQGTSASDETVRMPITGTLDLHTFSPAEAAALIQDYLEACVAKGIREARIIHGKGKGIQRHRVRLLLSRNPLVESYHDADLGGGGWGATIAVLKEP